MTTSFDPTGIIRGLRRLASRNTSEGLMLDAADLIEELSQSNARLSDETKRLSIAIDKALDLAIEAEVKSGVILNNVPRDDAAAARAFGSLIAWLRRDKQPEWNDRCDRAISDARGEDQ